MSMRAAIYLCESLGLEDRASHKSAIEAEAKSKNWQVMRWYEDRGALHAEGDNKQSALDRLVNDSKRGEFDIVVVFSLRHLGRSLPQLIKRIIEFCSSGVDLYVLKEGIDTTTEAGKAQYRLCEMLADHQYDLSRERVKIGLVSARAEGKKLGRPRIAAGIETAIRNDLLGGQASLRSIAAKYGVGMSVVQRIKHTDETTPS